MGAVFVPTIAVRGAMVGTHNAPTLQFSSGYAGLGA